MSIEEMLKERGETHGHFGDQWLVSQKIKLYGKNIPDNIIKEGFEMIALKMSRIAAGNPMFEEHWKDIIGYATKVLEHINNNYSPEKKKHV